MDKIVFEQKGPIDYRNSVVETSSLNNDLGRSLLGKIIVVWTKIWVIETVTPNFYKVHAYPAFPLYPRNPLHAKVNELLEPYQDNHRIGVYLRGEVYYDDFVGFITIRPKKGIPFLVGVEGYLR